MKVRLTTWLGDRLWAPGVRGLAARSAAFIVMLSPMVFMCWYTYANIRDILTDSTIARRQALADLAATSLKEKFDHLADLGVSFATRVQVRRHVGEEKWGEAIGFLGDVPEQFPFIERVFLTDMSGTQKAAVPTSAMTIGMNFRERDWYKGVTRSGKPYVSEVYRRAMKPQLNVIAVAVPIKDEKDRMKAILVLQIRSDVLLGWARAYDTGSTAFVYFVDQRGHLAAHPRFDPQGEIVDASSVLVVDRLLQGEKGVREHFNPVEREQRLSAYAPVQPYGWGVVVAQPLDDAYAPRNRTLQLVLQISGAVILIGLILASLILTTFAERRRAEEAFHKSEEQKRLAVEAANKELEAFSYSVSHDLRAPLRAIDGFSQILEEDHAAKLDQEAQRLLKVVRTNTKKMGDLIDDLLLFSRLSRKEIDRINVNMTDLVSAILEEHRAVPGAESADVKVGNLLQAKGDHSMLRQVWANLVSNAFKYTRKRERSAIEIGSMLEGSEIVYYVRDNGVGFDMQYSNKLFGVFQRLHSAEEFEGTGVGLAIVQRIVHRHGGRVWAEAEPNQGAVFYFTLPK